MPSRPAFLCSPSGASAAEFALTLPVLLGLTLGIFSLCGLMWSNTALHYAVEDTARCMSVKTTTCSTTANTQTYANQRYMGPTLTGLTFTPTFSTVCGIGGAAGNVVTATGQFTLSAIVLTKTVTVSATACAPT
jgi:Flp pilus assembly protein TadG